MATTGTYLVGGQLFTDFDAASAAEATLNGQMAAGGDAILRDPQAGGTLTQETQAYLDEKAAQAAAQAAVNAGVARAGVSPSTVLIAGALLGLAALVYWWET